MSGYKNNLQRQKKGRILKFKPLTLKMYNRRSQLNQTRWKNPLMKKGLNLPCSSESDCSDLLGAGLGLLLTGGGFGRIGTIGFFCGGTENKT